MTTKPPTRAELAKATKTVVDFLNSIEDDDDEPPAVAPPAETDKTDTTGEPT